MRISRTPLAVLATTLLLAGCGPGGGGRAEQNPEELDRDAKVEGEITFWHAYSEGGPEVETLEKTVLPAFEKANPGATGKPVTVQYDQLHQKLVTAAAGEALPATGLETVYLALAGVALVGAGLVLRRRFGTAS